jgi:MoaA/NifB/PqqE/SkfB family radical SAM enzyme
LNVFNRVVDNIGNFIRERKPTQRVEIANNLNLVNLHEAVQMVELGKKLGVDCVQFNPTHNGGRLDRPDLDPVRVGISNAQLFAEAQKAIEQRASELTLKVIMVRPLDLNLAKNLSTYPAQQGALTTMASPATP